MSAEVIPSFAMYCDECSAYLMGLATREDAEWAAASHDKALHAGPEVGGTR